MKETIKASCDVCGSSSAKEINIVKHYNSHSKLHICNICGFVYCHERRPSIEIKNDWKFKLYKNKFDKNTYDSNIPAVIARLTYAFEFLKNNVDLKNKSLCDVGAGKGEFIVFARNANLTEENYGIEMSIENAKILKKKKIKFSNLSLEDFVKSNSNRQFDIISLNWTLENMQSAKECIENCNRLLKKEGRLLISTGSRILVPFKKPLKYYIPKDNPIDVHPFHFSANSLKTLLNNYGFGDFILNRFIDSEYLCIIAKKLKVKNSKKKMCDDPKKVHEFFRRWHKESSHYN